MTTEDNIDIVLRQPSAEFIQICEEFAQSFERPKAIYKKLVDKGKEEGYNDVEIDILITTHLKGKIPKTSFYRYRDEFLEIPAKKSQLGQNDDKKDTEDSSIDTQDTGTAPIVGLTQEDLDKINQEPDDEDEEEDQEEIESEPEPVQRTPEAPDNSMVEQLHIINIGLKKDVERLMDENIRLKQENQELKAELGRHRRLEELRLEAQRKAIKQWNTPGDRP